MITLISLHLLLLLRQGERIEIGNDVDGALDRLFAAQESYLLHVCIPAEENVWPLVPPNACIQIC